MDLVVELELQKWIYSGTAHPSLHPSTGMRDLFRHSTSLSTPLYRNDGFIPAQHIPLHTPLQE